MKGRPWAKFDVGMVRDAKVATLSSDAVRWAFVAIILAAKESDRPGYFESLKHLSAVVSPSVAESAQELVDSGLLAVDPDGSIHVAKWKRYQIDPTGSERVKRYRERQVGALVKETPRGGKPTKIGDLFREVGS
jgi:hypothetical protein